MTTAEERAAMRAADRLAGLMTRMAARTAPLSGRIPVLEEDPDADDPTNLWLLEEGRLRAKGADGTIFEFISAEQMRPTIPTFNSDPSVGTGWVLWWRGDTGDLKGRMANGTIKTILAGGATSTTGGAPAVGSAISIKPKPADPKPRRYRKEYGAQWGRSFCSEHGLETGSELNYGDLGSGYHGERRIMIGFDDPTIRSDTAGATIKKFQIRARNADSWAHGGIKIRWGGHTQNAAPGSYSALRRDVWSGRWPESGYGAESTSGWRSAHTWFAKAFRDDDIRGLTIDQNSGRAEYGALEWSTVKIAVEYVK